MAYTPTPWGYDAEGLEPLVDEATFRAVSGSTATSEQVEAALSAASSLVRSYCGWHVTPVLNCKAEGMTARSAVLRLPALRVESVSSVTEDGAELDASAYQWRREGLLRKAYGRWTPSWGGITVEYSAGVPECPDASRICVQLAANALAPMGVSQESAGGVSITYNKDSSGQGGSLSLTESMRAVLDPYKLPAGAW